MFYLSALLTYDYYDRIEVPRHDIRVSFHRSVVDGTAPYQLRYRVLVPYVAEGIMKVAGQILPPERSFRLTYMVLNFAALAIFFGSLLGLLHQWFGPGLAYFGLALSAVIIDFTFRHHSFHPWSFWEASLCALAMLWISRKHWSRLVPLSIAAAMIRETTALLPLGFLLAVLPLNPRHWRSAELRRREVRVALGSIFAWAATLAAVHAVVGYRPATFSIQTAIAGNLQDLRLALILNFLMAGPLLMLAARGVLRSAPVVRGMALAAIPYVCVLSVIGYWWEIRYWMAILPVLVPAVIQGLIYQRISCEPLDRNVPAEAWLSYVARK